MELWLTAYLGKLEQYICCKGINHPRCRFPVPQRSSRAACCCSGFVRGSAGRERADSGQSLSMGGRGGLVAATGAAGLDDEREEHRQLLSTSAEVLPLFRAVFSSLCLQRRCWCSQQLPPWGCGGGMCRRSIFQSCGHRAGTAEGFLSSAFKCFLVTKVAVSLGWKHLTWLFEHHLISPAPTLRSWAWVGRSCLGCWPVMLRWWPKLDSEAGVLQMGKMAWLCPVQELRNRLSCGISAPSVYLVLLG